MLPARRIPARLPVCPVLADASIFEGSQLFDFQTAASVDAWSAWSSKASTSGKQKAAKRRLQH